MQHVVALRQQRRVARRRVADAVAILGPPEAAQVGLVPDDDVVDLGKPCDQAADVGAVLAAQGFVDSDNPRTILYGSGYEAFAPRDVRSQRTMTARLVGKHCESGDVIVFDAQLPADLRPGDLVATPVTGAYGHSMASNYNKLTRPPVVFVSDGGSRVVVRRETLEDLVRCDVG